MESTVKTYSFPTGEIQRVQLVRPDSWESLSFMTLRWSEGAMDCYSHIYRQFLVPRCPWLFGHLVLFHLPRDLEVPFPKETGRWGSVCDPLTAAAAALRRGVRIRGGKPCFRSQQVKAFWQALESRGSVRVVSGKLPVTTIIAVSDFPGYMTQNHPDAKLKANASFFVMDPFDCATVYDQVGVPIGLCVKDGVVENPPLFRREALLVRKDGRVSVEEPDISRLSMEIGGKTYIPGKNCRVYTRPEHSHTPGGKGVTLVIIGIRVAAVCRGRASVPASGFVLCPEEECAVRPGDQVRYLGMEDVTFGIQVGNSIIRGGVKTDRFRSRFYNIYALERVPYPPCLYPLNYNKDRAARMALGADEKGKPMLLWAEGSPKLGYTVGKQSRGASLSDMADFCADLGMVNAVNLDGGGSAQILLEGKRALQISDRNTDHSEAERPVPLGLAVF